MSAKHTPWPWEAVLDPYSNDDPPGFAEWYVLTKDEVQVAHVSTLWDGETHIDTADAYLLALAPTAPHACDDPQCPGNVNRLKLEAFPELLNACINLLPMAKVACEDYDELDTQYIKEAQAAIAKAEPARE